MIGISGSSLLFYLFFFLFLVSTQPIQDNLIVEKSQHNVRHLQRSYRSTRRFHRHSNQIVKSVSTEQPIYILFPVPVKRGELIKNPFGITMDLVRPVVDIALENIYQNKLIPEDSIKSYFKDTHLSDAHGPNVAINQLVANKLDCIIGYAFVYALTPVARVSSYWKSATNNGIPVITTIGLTTNLDNKHKYKLLTRIISPYKILTKAIRMIFNRMNWLNVVYVFHEKRYGGTTYTVNVPYSECYLQMVSLQMQQYESYQMDHNYFMFNELKFNRIQILDILMKASELGNGLFFDFFVIV
uniref:ANF_receptor domain-containing protein n=1 Tax=Elaeophora elaphi TaxID=1147741 RepID=A0A0R3RMM5_9BILA